MVLSHEDIPPVLFPIQTPCLKRRVGFFPISTTITFGDRSYLMRPGRGMESICMVFGNLCRMEVFLKKCILNNIKRASLHLGKLFYKIRFNSI